MKTIDAGVFIPVGNHGWIHSTNAPAVEDGSFKRVLEITKGAEALGFDFVLSPSIWRGLKGPSEHWMRALESVTTSAALLQATSRIQVFSTVHMTVHPPAVIAKKMATLDEIGPGRVGLNLVTGSSYLDLAHVGLWRGGLNHDERYDLADEWTAVVKRLWSEKSVTHKGKFFELNEATMGPKPSRRPRMVNAGSSGRGFKFAADNCDIALIAMGDDAKAIESGKQAKAMAREMNRPDLKVNGLFIMIPGETDDDARARLAHFDEGVDVECLEDIALGYSKNPDIKEVSAGSLRRAYGRERRTAVSPQAMVGSYESLTNRLAKAITEGELDGVTLVVPDYVEDLKAIAARVLSRLPEYGISCRVGAA
jgi:pyrimidine oxygenase